jgi:hypothetical protein
VCYTNSNILIDGSFVDVRAWCWEEFLNQGIEGMKEST